MRVKQALKWSLFSEVAAKLIQPLVLLALASLLTPEDFGVMSAGVMVLAFSQIFWEAGMGKALIQCQTNVQEAANATFWVNLALAIFIAGSLHTIAPYIALNIFHDSRVTGVLQVMVLQVLLGALGSVHTALLQKQMGFKKLFWVRFATVSLPGLASIPLALQGMGYWALVAGSLIGQLAQLLMLWRMSSWRPGLSFSTKVAGTLLRFGSWTAFASLLNWFYAWGDTFFIGKYLGLADLGTYRVATQVGSVAFTIIFSAILPVYYSYAVSQGDRKQLFLNTTRAVQQISFISLSAGYFFLIFGVTISSFLFTDRWLGIGGLLGILGFQQGFAWITCLNEDFYRAIGKAHLPSLVLVLSLFFYVPIYYITAQMDLKSFAYGRLGLVIASMLSHLLLYHWIVGMHSLQKFLKIIMQVCLCFTPFYLCALHLTESGGYMPIANLFLWVPSFLLLVSLSYKYIFKPSVKLNLIFPNLKNGN